MDRKMQRFEQARLELVETPLARCVHCALLSDMLNYFILYDVQQ